jgi:hypothetical protein
VAFTPTSTGRLWAGVHTLQEFLEKPTSVVVEAFLIHPVARAATDTKRGGWNMSPLTIFWLGCGLLTIAIAVWKKLNVVPWILVGPVLGPLGIILVLMQAAAKTSAGTCSADGSTYYGGDGSIDFSGGHHCGLGGFDGGGGHGGFC